MKALAHYKYGTRNNNCTALMTTAINLHTETARVITKHEHGYKDLHGYTILMIAVRNK